MGGVTKETAMGLFDDIGGVLKGTLSKDHAVAGSGLIAAMLAKTDVGGLAGIVAKLQQAGLDRQVQSWLGSGSNMPLSADQLRSALGNEQVQQIARQFGLPVDRAIELLAEQVPTAVDDASPDGHLPPES
jgi:uncharacterized protein YidB (DUF937 family)